jgi:hypothetical protein
VFDDIARRAVFGRAAAAATALWAFPAEARRRHKKKNKKKKKKGTNAPVLPAADVLTAFVLATGCGTSVVPPCACNACEKHAANKLFASREAVVRAHPKCNCQVEALSLPRGTWLALFQPAGLPATGAVDKRDPRVQQIL